MRQDMLNVIRKEGDLIFQNPSQGFTASCYLLDQFLLKIILSGKLTYPDSITLNEKLHEAITQNIKLDSYNKAFYMIIDAKDLTAIDYQSKKLLSKFLTRYYDHPFIRYISIVSSSPLIFSLGAYYNKIMRNAPISFHNSEKTAIKTIFQQRYSNNELWFENENLNGNDEYLQKSFMYFKGERLKVESSEDWNASDIEHAYRHNIFLLDKNIVVIKANGYLFDKHIIQQAVTVKKVVSVSGLKNLKIIIDYSEIKGMHRSSKKLLEKELLAFWDEIYVVLGSSLKLTFKMYFFFRTGIGGTIKSVNDINEALQLIFTKNTNEKPTVDKKEKQIKEPATELASLGRKELVELVDCLRREKEGILKSQEQKINKLFEIVSRITWDEDFKPSPIMTEKEDDAFFDLYNSVSLLQQDVYEMVEELKELNRDLEEKVEERTKMLADKEANLSSLIENTKDMICSVDKNYRLLVANKAYQDFICENYNDEIKPGDNILSGLHDDIVGYWKPFYDRALKGETFDLIETRLIDSRKAFFEISFNPIWSKNKEVTGFSVFIREITQQKESELTLERSQQLLASINDNIKEGIYRSNENGNLVYVNPAFVEIFGFDDEQELYSMPFSNLYWNQDDRAQLLDTIKSEGRITNIEIKFRKKDCSFFWGLITSSRVVDDKGNEFFDGSIRDITRIKETDIMLKKQNEELKKVNTELDRFVYSASHDLRAPLMSILGLISVTRIEKSEDEKEKCMNMMEKSIKKLDSFIQDIINYSRNKRLLINRDRIDFEALITEIFKDLQYLKKSRSVERRIHVEANDEFYTDLRRLKIILYNIISNSIVYSATIREASVDVTVTVKGKFATIVVADNGQGIQEVHIEKIFNMFYRASEEEAGSGLGLYLVKETVEALEGNVNVTSNVGRGATFTVTLPNLK
jgi:PAS domain S-box-containing protein